MAGANVIQATDTDFDSQVQAAGGKPVLVDFWAEWCQPCRMLGPTIDALATEYAGRAVVVKVNVDEAPELAGRYGVQSIPTILAFKNGQPVKALVGVRPKKELAGLLDGLLG